MKNIFEVKFKDVFFFTNKIFEKGEGKVMPYWYKKQSS